MGGTCGSGVLSSSYDVLEISVGEMTEYRKDNSLLISAPKSSVTLLTPDTHQV